MTKAKKFISAREFYERMKTMRKRPHKPELIEKFNKIVESDEKYERERQDEKPNRKIARPLEADL